MPLTDLQLSALTDIILACEFFLLAGLTFGANVTTSSARFAFGCYFGIMGLATMLGAIDHGFLEEPPHPAHPIMTFLTRATLLMASVVLLWATCREYLSVGVSRVLLALGGVVVAFVAVVIWSRDNFLLVAAPSVVVFLLMLGLSVWAAIRGYGNPLLTLGLVLTLSTAFILVSGTNGVFGLGLYGTLHVATMIAALVMFWGGLRLKDR